MAGTVQEKLQQQMEQQMEQQTEAISKLSEQVKRLELALTKLDNKCSHCNEKPVRESGYVNWDESHDFIKNMKWSKISDYFKTGYIHWELDCKIINENTRFPEDQELYVNISDPTFQYIIKYKRRFRLTERREYHFLTLFKDHMHTQSSFEEKYKLRWMDPKEQNSTIKKD